MSMPGPATANVNPSDASVDNDTWIGVDFGTSNSTVSVWDSTRGRAKVLEMGEIAVPRLTRSGSEKVGRHVPMVIALQLQPGLQSLSVKKSFVGLPAQEMLFKHDSDTGAHKGEWLVVSSIKRLITHLDPLSAESELEEEQTTASTAGAILQIVSSLEGASAPKLRSDDFHWNFKEDDVALVHRGHNSRSEDVVVSSVVELVSLFLSKLRIQAQSYLTSRKAKRKQLQIPNHPATSCTNVVLGIPVATPSRRYKTIMTKAARMAGFSGAVEFRLEPTAASLTYGLSSKATTTTLTSRKRVLVFDMGGGTTDVTVIEPNQSTAKSTCGDLSKRWKVVTTRGNSKLGGNDIDRALYRRLLENTPTTSAIMKEEEFQSSSLLECRRVKEALSSEDENGKAVAVHLPGQKRGTLSISLIDFNVAIAPLIGKARSLTEEVLSCLQTEGELDSRETIGEVVLVGGSTKVPAIQRMLHELFPHIPEFCTSTNPHSAVSEGLAIQAALSSQSVPLYQLESALMLDVVPHAMGVLITEKVNGNGRKDEVVEKERMVQVLAKDMPLPASGSAFFQVGDPRGVTVVAVEEVTVSRNQEGNEDTATFRTFERVGEFNFLLRKLHNTPQNRMIEIGFTMEPSGRFICSIFDEHDPEHVRRRNASLANKGASHENDLIKQEEEMPWGLIILVVFLSMLYVGVKIAFNDPNTISNEIM